MAKNNPFARALNTTPENADPLNLVDIQDLRKNPPVLPAVVPQTLDPVITEAIQNINKGLPQGAQLLYIAPGSKGLIIKKEFNPEIKTRIEQLKTELLQIAGIKSQDDVQAANATLKKAKGLEKALEAEGLLMRSGLKEESDDIINMVRNVLSPISPLITTVNGAIISFQVAETERIAALNKKIAEEKAEALRVANAEIKRKADIQAEILGFEANVLEASGKATTENIDEKINQLVNFAFDKAEMAEFMPQALEAQSRSIVLLRALKEELFLIAASGAKEKAELEAQALTKQRELADQLALKEETVAESTQEEAQAAVTDALMTSQLKISIIPKQKGVSRPWTFDEETIDLALLPLEYHTFDKKKIKEAITSGKKEIPGVNIYQKIQNSSR